MVGWVIEDGAEASPPYLTARLNALVLRLTVDDGGPVAELGLPHGAGVMSAQLARVDGDRSGPATSWEWSLGRSEESRPSLWARGVAGDLVRSVCIDLDADGDWLAITEALSSSGPTGMERPGLGAVRAFESRWTFPGAAGVREVFSPCLVPEPGDVVGQHVLRAPVLVAESETAGVVIAVDVGCLERPQELPAALNLLRATAGDVELTVGLRAHRPRSHVYYTGVRPSPEIRGDTLSHRYEFRFAPVATPGESLTAARRRIWPKGAAASPGILLDMPPAAYAREIYPPVLAGLWAETVLAGTRVGAITNNRAYRGDVWFSSWFNPLRASYGLFHYGLVLGRDNWVDMARSTRSLALSAPLTGNLFPTVFAFGHDRWVGSHHQGGGPGIFHLMDMSWSMYQLLRWHQDLEADPASVDRARGYADALAGLQRDDGGLPAYVDASGAPITAVSNAALRADVEGQGGDRYVPHMLGSGWVEDRYVTSAEDSASLLFLAELAATLPPDDPGRERALTIARGIAGFLARRVIAEARWDDFEVYFSCSPKALDFYDRRSGQWPQNTLCMHHAAAGLLRLHELTGEAGFLDLGARAMDRLSLYQQVWSPPWLGLNALGGYGVMNTDAEWNDARQAQFAETHLAYWRATGEGEHLERALAAARSAFTTVFLPVSAPRYSGWWRDPQGMAAENHGHSGGDDLCGVSGFDWGSGSALATAAHFERQSIAL